MRYIMLNRKLLGLIAGSVLMLLAGCATNSTSPQAAPTATSATLTTQVIRFTPAIPNGESQAGSCWTNSLAALRDDAWRCQMDNSLSDPCFVVGADHTMVCGADPATNEPGFVVKLTEPLPTPDVPEQAKQSYQAWLIQLADGTICNFATGATTGANGERVNYLCSDKTMILGDLKPGTTWTAQKVIIEVGANGPAITKGPETVSIRTVWQ